MPMVPLTYALTLAVITLSLSPSSSSSSSVAATRHGAGAAAPPISSLISYSCSDSWGFIFSKWDPKLCAQILVTSDPRSASAADYLTLGQIVLNAGIANMSNSITDLNSQLRRNSSLPKPLKQKVKACIEDYEVVIRNFRSALGELKDDPQTANYDLTMAGNDALILCRDEWEKVAEDYPRITRQNLFISYFITAGGTITNYLEHHAPPSPRLLV